MKICNKCKKEFTGNYCWYCGTTYENDDFVTIIDDINAYKNVKKIFRNENKESCSVCNLTMSWLDNKDNYGVELPSSGNVRLCKTCADKLYWLSKILKIEESVWENNYELINSYVRNRKNVVRAYKEIKDSTFKNDLKRNIIKADNIYMKYHEYPRIISEAFNKISENLEKMPFKKQNYGYSTFARDDENLYYMEYGKPLYNSNEIISIQGYKERMEVLERFQKEIINKTTLIQFINLNEIEYFKYEGEVNYTTTVSGGGSKGVSYSRAILGGLLFGPAGAIVGAMKGNEIKEIKSSYIEHDNRYIVLVYKDTSGKVVKKKLNYEYYELFNKLIPEKEYDYVQLNSKNSIKSKNEHSVPYEQLKELKSLVDLGVISEEEFNAKKKQLLQI